MSSSAAVRLDTHVAVWLYVGEAERLSQRAAEAIETGQPVISPMVTLELSFLHEIGRLSVGGNAIVADLSTRIGLTVSPVVFDEAVAAAMPMSFARDPFDRLIAGDALAAGSKLVTKDQQLLEHVGSAIW